MKLPPNPGPIGIQQSILHCNWLLSYAAESARRCETDSNMAAKGESEPKQKDALSSLLFPAAAMEAFINEITSECHRAAQADSADPVLAKFAWGLRAAEDSNATTKHKFELADLLLTGTPPDRGTQVFSDFNVLFGLRNDIMHIKRPSTIGVTDDSDSSQIPSRVTYLINRKLTRQMPEGYRTHWLIHLMTPRVAWWACNTASAICTHVAHHIPNKGISASYTKMIQASIE